MSDTIDKLLSVALKNIQAAQSARERGNLSIGSDNIRCAYDALYHLMSVLAEQRALAASTQPANSAS